MEPSWNNMSQEHHANTTLAGRCQQLGTPSPISLTSSCHGRSLPSAPNVATATQPLQQTPRPLACRPATKRSNGTPRLRVGIQRRNLPGDLHSPCSGIALFTKALRVDTQLGRRAARRRQRWALRWHRLRRFAGSWCGGRSRVLS